ncbi:MAG: Fic family protein [Verrucomicrobia bacterium]|nr:Fic family protein [Verrucomicrobiota bacterium]
MRHLSNPIKSMNPQFQITNSITEDLSRIDQAKGFLDATKLSEEWLGEMERRALVREAHYTTHIEGSQLTLEQAERLLQGEKLPDVDPEDERELRNWIDAFEFVKQYVVGGAPITERMVLEIHRRLVTGVRGGSASPGQYREKQNYVINNRTKKVVYTPPPANEVPGLMASLVEWMNTPSAIHPVLKSGVAQFQLVHIHPFRDGNGRTSRLLFTLCMYRAGYDFKRMFTISEFYDRDRQAFYNAIQGVRDSNMDLTGWLEYFARGLATQLVEVKERGQRVIQTDLLAQRHTLSDRQKRVIGFLFEKQTLLFSDLADAFADIPRRTLQRDLKTLVDLGLLVTSGATSSLRYSLKKPMQ